MGIVYDDEERRGTGIKYDEPEQPRPWGMEGYTQRLGMGIPWSDEIMAGMLTPIEMARQGVGPAEAYRYAKERENAAGARTRANTEGVGGVAAEVAGSLATGAGLLGSGTRLGAASIGGLNIPAKATNYLANVGKTGAFGALTGAGEGDTLEERGKGALIGGGVGLGVGAALPPLLAGASATARALQLPRLRDPEKIATEHIAKVARDAGVPMEELANRMAAARAAGQTEYTIADALGKEGQRKLAAAAKVPGPAREQITEALTTRDLNMPERLVEQVGRKMGVTGTAQQATEELAERAGREAGPLYRQAENQGAVWNERIQEMLQDPIMQKGLAQGLKLQRLESLGTGRAANTTDPAITSFNAAGDPIITGVPNMKTLQAVKVGLDAMIEAQTDAVTRRMTNEGRILVGVKNRLLEQIDAINPTYARARATYADPMQVREAVRLGQHFPTHGRAADNIRGYEAMRPAEQAGARIGVADTISRQVERTGNIPTYLRAKSPKGQQELEALSPYGPATLREALAREEAMQRTSRQALGGSQTAENLADMAQGPGGAETLGLIGNVAHGNIMGAMRGGAEMLARVGRGESEAQRSAIARALLANDPNAVAAMQRRIAEHELRRRGVNPWQPHRRPRYRAGQ